MCCCATRIVRQRRWTGLLLVLPLLSGCGTLALVADDTVVMSGRPAPLRAYLGRKDLFDLHNNVRDTPVSFLVGGRQIGQQMVDQEGQASVVINGGGAVPASFEARANVGGRKLQSTGRIFHWRQDRVILAIDLDYCVVQTNYLRLLFGRHIPVSPPFEGAREALIDLAKDYQILYFTARPRSMLNRTRDWLDHYQFPPGPVIVSDRFRDVLRQLEWKRDALKELQAQYSSLLVSVGNRQIDVQSALPNNILPVIVQSIENDTEDGSGTVLLKDWASLREFFRVNQLVLQDPGRLSQAIRQGTTLQQPVPQAEGKYLYIDKCVNCRHEHADSGRQKEPAAHNANGRPRGGTASRDRYNHAG